MRRDATASKCFVQLVGNRKLAGKKTLIRPCLPASELASFQNYVGLRGWTRTCRPYPAFHGMRKSSTCGFVFADYGMLGGCRPGPVNRHSFGIAGWAGARSAPTTVPGPAGWPFSGWRPALRKRKRRTAEFEMSRGRWRRGRRQRRCPRGRAPAGRKGLRGPIPRPHSRTGFALRAATAKVFPKLSLHRRPSSRIVLLRTGA